MRQDNKSWWVNGEITPITKLEDSHLLNVIRMIESKAIKGVEKVWFVGYDYDDGDPYYAPFFIKGRSLIQEYYPAYDNLILEARDRNLISDDDYIIKISTCLICKKKLKNQCSKYEPKKYKCKCNTKEFYKNKKLDNWHERTGIPQII